MPLKPSQLKMLKARPSWESYTGDDTWGNDTYAQPVDIEAFVGTFVRRTGSSDGLGTQDDEITETGDLITDFRGIKPKDRITLDTGVVTKVVSADVVHDKFGVPLMQNVNVETTERG